jgi:hypothetical protein
MAGGGRLQIACENRRVEPGNSSLKLATAVFCRSPFEASAAARYSDIVLARRRAGNPIEGFDALIAATALAREASVATRDTGGFAGCGLTFIDPWTASQMDRSIARDRSAALGTCRRSMRISRMAEVAGSAPLPISSNVDGLDVGELGDNDLARQPLAVPARRRSYTRPDNKPDAASE